MLPFELYIVPVTAFEQNCSILVCKESGRAAVVDPGGDLDRIVAAISESGAEVETILLTHGHMDHAGGADELREILGVPIEGPHWLEEPLLSNIPVVARPYGLDGARSVHPNRWLNHGDDVRIGCLTLEVLHCPGHTRGSVVFFWRGDRTELDEHGGFAIVGDVLFRGDIGRTDLPGGDRSVLVQSIRQHIIPLGDDVLFLPGHGEIGKIGQERKSNPHLI